MCDHSEKFYTIEETLNILRISRATAQRKLKNHEIPSIKIGRRVLIPSSYFERLIQGAFYHTNDVKEAN